MKVLLAILLASTPTAAAYAAAWQLDIQTAGGGPVANGQPVTATFDPDGVGPVGSSWNAYEVQQITEDYNDPNSDSAADPAAFLGLVDSHGHATGVSFDIVGEVQGYNTQINDDDVPVGGFYAAVGDHLFFAQGDSDINLGFVFANLPRGIYRVTAYSNPTFHLPSRGFTLQIGSQWVDIVPADFSPLASPASITGRFEGVAVGPNGELAGELRYLAGHGDPSVAAMRVEQTAGPDPSGDFNFDGKTDAADYTIWRDNLGSVFTSGDYAIWKSHFGQDAGTAASTPVPEPASLRIFLAAFVGCLPRSRAPRAAQRLNAW